LGYTWLKSVKSNQFYVKVKESTKFFSNFCLFVGWGLSSHYFRKAFQFFSPFNRNNRGNQFHFQLGQSLGWAEAKGGGQSPVAGFSHFPR
jgi:hypothetical protein